MPIEELLALYNCLSSAPPTIATTTSSGTRRSSTRSRRASRPVPAPVAKETITAIEPKIEESETTPPKADVDAVKPTSPARSDNEIVKIETKADVETAEKSDKTETLEPSEKCEKLEKSDKIEKLEKSPLQAKELKIDPTNNNADEIANVSIAKDVESIASDSDDEEDEEEEESELRKLYPETFKNKDQRLLRG